MVLGAYLRAQTQILLFYQPFRCDSTRPVSGTRAILATLRLAEITIEPAMDGDPRELKYTRSPEKLVIEVQLYGESFTPTGRGISSNSAIAAPLFFIRRNLSEYEGSKDIP